MLLLRNRYCLLLLGFKALCTAEMASWKRIEILINKDTLGRTSAVGRIRVDWRIVDSTTKHRAASLCTGADLGGASSTPPPSIEQLPSVSVPSWETLLRLHYQASSSFPLYRSRVGRRFFANQRGRARECGGSACRGSRSISCTIGQAGKDPGRVAVLGRASPRGHDYGSKQEMARE